MSNMQPLAGAPALQLGKYRLIIELAQGGMGYVYLAVAQGPAGFNKLAVIKELKPSLLEEQGFLDMFLDEARLSARLSHPNVVQTNEVGVADGRAFLAMEYLDGQSLNRVRSRLLKTSSLPLGADVRIVAFACAGLHYAHELRDFDGRSLGVVHRDVSPHNIFVTYDGQVKIVDFGVAKALSSNHESNVGVLKGKVPYMSPEQITGGDLDRRADIYALGVVLWEAVARQRIWGSLRSETILARVMSREIPRLAEVAPQADRRLVAIVERAMAYSVDARYPTAAALQHDLEEWLASAPDGDYRSVAAVGTSMTRAFATERAQVTTSVNDQLRLLASSTPEVGARSVGLVRLPSSGTGSHDALSGGAALQHASGAGSGRISSNPLRIVGAAPSSPYGLTPSVAERVFDHSSNATVSMAVAASAPPVRTPPPSATHKGMVAALAVAAGVLVGGAALAAYVVSRPKAAPVSVATATPLPNASASTASSSAPATSSDEGGRAGSVELTLHVTPSNARVYIDNGALPKAAQSATFKRDGLTHRVRAEAPGYVSRTELVTFEQDTEVTLQLDRVGAPVTQARPRPSATADPRAETPSKPGRPQRPIDTDLDPR